MLYAQLIRTSVCWQHCKVGSVCVRTAMKHLHVTLNKTVHSINRTSTTFDPATCGHHNLSYKCGWNTFSAQLWEHKWCFTSWPWVMWPSYNNVHECRSAAPWWCSQQQVTERWRLFTTQQVTLMKTVTQSVFPNSYSIGSTLRLRAILDQKINTSAESSSQPRKVNPPLWVTQSFRGGTHKVVCTITD